MNTEQLLRALVNCPTVNPMGGRILPDLHLENRVVDVLASVLQEARIPFTRRTVAPGRDNLLTTFTPKSPTGHLLWESHTDTVAVTGMTIDPFAGTTRDGKLYGRGACDVKGGLTAMLQAFLRLHREQPEQCAQVTLACTVDEEHTFLGVQDLVKNGLKVDGAIVAEPTSLNIVNCHKGVIRWHLQTTGVACHSSRPQDGVNSIYRMTRIIQLLQEHAQHLQSSPPHPLLGPPSLSVGKIEGGVSVNTVPDRCLIEIDRRMLPGEKAAEIHENLMKLIAQSGVPDVSVTTTLTCPALQPDLSQLLTQQLGASINAVVGHHQVLAVPYGTDASTLAEAGIPAVVFGPGDIAQAHTKDEWIELQQIDIASEILYHAAKTFPVAG
ncbi:MAG: M20 family metallopeptidase [Zavarzinella sp.]